MWKTFLPAILRRRHRDPLTGRRLTARQLRNDQHPLRIDVPQNVVGEHPAGSAKERDQQEQKKDGAVDWRVQVPGDEDSAARCSGQRQRFENAIAYGCFPMQNRFCSDRMNRLPWAIAIEALHFSSIRLVRENF